jgi:ABC-2 type transport system ATP-binding protein
MTDLSVRQLSKQFGTVRAVEELSFDAPAGQVTGFLGPNGAGKTTTLRMLLGLVRPTAGEALIGGVRYEQLRDPTRVVGAVLEYSASNPGRTGRDQLRVLASVTGASTKRVDEVIEQVDLRDAVNRRVSGYSTGMRQRLGLAAALLGNPDVLILDEPANGLDPEGIAWLRNLLRSYAADGRTILVSSHVLSEIAQTVDRVVIISHGQLRYAGSLTDLAGEVVTVRTADLERLSGVLRGHGYSVSVTGPTSMDVRGATADEIGRLAAGGQIALAGLAEAGASLEAAFLKLTNADDSSRRSATANRGA